MESLKFTFVKAITQTRIPIIKARHYSTNIDIDISFTDGLGVRNTLILDHWLSLQDSEAQKFALFIRKWFDMWNYAGGSFHKNLDLMVIYFLQWEGFLPSFWKVRDYADETYYVRGVDSGFDENADRYDYGVDSLDDYKDHIKEFFRFYRDFDFAQHVVCPFVGSNHMVDRYNLPYDDMLYEE